MTTRISILLLGLTLSFYGYSQDSTDIFSILSNSNITIHQDSRITQKVRHHKQLHSKQDDLPYRGARYRVQVFSSNNQRTAKSEAFRIERLVKSTFPNTGVYVTFSAPFWKVRAGNFRDTADAEEMKKELIRMLPELQKTTYTVREKEVRIN